MAKNEQLPLTHSMDITPGCDVWMVQAIDPNVKAVEIIAFPWILATIWRCKQKGLSIRRIHGQNGLTLKKPESWQDVTDLSKSILLNTVGVLPNFAVVKTAEFFDIPEVLVHTGVAKSMDKSLLKFKRRLVIENNINKEGGLEETLRIYEKIHQIRNKKGLETVILIDVGHVKQEFGLSDREAMQRCVKFKNDHPDIPMTTHCSLQFGGDIQGSISLQDISIPILIDYVTAFDDITVEHQIDNPYIWLKETLKEQFIYDTRRSLAWLKYARSLTS